MEESTSGDSTQLVVLGDEIPPNETEEEILARTQRYQANVRELQMGDVEEYSEEWYRIKYPGFPDEFYPIFVKVTENNLTSE